MLSAASCLLGSVLMAFGVRNCVRLWRLPRGAAPAGSMRVLGLFALLFGLLAILCAGPLSTGMWMWEAVLFTGLASYFLLVLARELNARTQRTPLN